jgi:DNA-binding transcriptional MerR regulator
LDIVENTEVKNMNKKNCKKIIGGLMVVMLLTTIGAVLVSADTEDVDETADEPLGKLWGAPMRCRAMFIDQLTEEQREEIKELVTRLNDEGATCQEIREAIKAKLEEFGVEMPTPDERLENAIEQTEKKLEILNRVKELREDGTSWEEIKDIIQDEYELPTGAGHGMKFRRGFRCGPCGGPSGLMTEEEPDL